MYMDTSIYVMSSFRYRYSNKLNHSFSPYRTYSFLSIHPFFLLRVFLLVVSMILLRPMNGFQEKEKFKIKKEKSR